MSDRPPIEFYAYEHHGPDEKEFAELREKLKRTDGIDRFRGQVSHQDHDATRRTLAKISSGGYTSIPVLPELIGLPLSDLVLGWLAAVRPSAIRITRGEFHTDACPWRVSITLDDNDRIESITQEVGVAFGCGSDMAALLREAKTGERAGPCGGVIGNVAGLERVDFE